MKLPPWPPQMDQGDLDLMDRAYARRIELMAQPGVKWVAMSLSGNGVLLTLEQRSGEQLEEWIQRVEPADGGSANSAYDRE